MDEIKRARVRIILCLIGLILVIHAGIAAYIMRDRLFGKSSGHPPAATAAATAETAAGAAAKPVAPPTPAFRFKVPSANPRFGAPLDFSSARHGDLPPSEVPGSAGAVAGIIVDMNSRKVLWEKNSDRKVKIASMVKMMTLLVAMEDLEKRPELNLNTQVQISRTVLKIPRTGVVWLDPREVMPLQDLMKAAAIKSANDAATMIAEFLGGDVDSYVNRMNRRAAELGLTRTSFVNPCGLPDAKRGNSLSSVRDMVVLGERLLEYPQLMQWMGCQQDSIRNGKFMLVTTNKLVNPRWPGVDGLKTGYFRAAGFCLTFSVLRDQRRMIGCVTGFPTARDRDRFCRKLINWAYNR